ncbi:ABC transporter substrate-binding protein [Streptomyces canus]|uniref:peptide ABC transporter substrate-binding protein n=1 Tax=Streptomyces canus TaxID=58343 RepID=UPI0033C090B0
MAAAIWTPLTTVDTKSGKVVNAVAESIKSTDKKTWTINLKQNWTFHNGESVTAQSFVDAWNLTAYAPNTMPFNYLFMNFKGYDALNPTKGKPATDKLSGVAVTGKFSLKVTLKTPLSTFPDLLASTPFAPLPKAALSSKNFTAFDKLPIGNGPYKVVSPGIGAGAQQITLQRYDKYAGTEGKAQTITVKAYQSNATAFTSFRAGAVDIATVNGSDLSAASRSYKNQLVTAGTPAVVYLGFPLWDERFKDRRVREAFSLAIDREAIAKALLHGFAKPADGVIPEVLEGGGHADCAQCTYDPARAKKLLQQAGGWNGSLTLWTKQDATTQTVLEAILDQLRKNLGITNIDLQAKPLDQMYSALGAKKVSGPFLLYTGASYPSSYSLVDSLFSSSSGANVTGYDSKKFAAQLDAANLAPTNEIPGLVRTAARTALNDVPMVPVYYPQTGLVHSNRVGNVVIDYLADADLAKVTVK